METKQKIIAGRKPLLDSLSSDLQFEKVLIDRELTGETEIKIRKLCKDKNIPLQRVPGPVLDKYSETQHQGVIGLVTSIEYAPFEETIDDLIYQTGNPVFIFLDQIKDVRNFGAIARSAEVFGAAAIVIPGESSAPVNDIAIKTSAGALLNLPVCRVSSLLTALKTIKLHGVKVVATGMSMGKPVAEEDFSGPVALVMGSEEKGVRPHLERVADSFVYIPQIGKTESLNVSVAAGIILYEIARQRNFS